MRTASELRSSSSSLLLESELVQRFIALGVDERSEYDISVDSVDVDQGGGDPDFDDALWSYGLPEDVIDGIDHRGDGPDILGRNGDALLSIEAKAKRKVPNNAEHEIPKFKCKNIPECGDAVESALLIPRDCAKQFYNRLCYDDGLGVEGYIHDFESTRERLVEMCDIESLEYSIYTVWNDIQKHSFVDFLDSEYQQYSENTLTSYEIEDLESIDRIVPN